MLMGMSWSEEIFTIRNVHISLLAVPDCLARLLCPAVFFLLSGAFSARRSSSSFPNSSIAFNPAGVAAQPSPSMFAIIFVAIYLPAGCPSGRFGKRNRITGRIFSVSASMSPALSPIFKIPHQNDMIPSIVTPSVTASFAESSSPFVTSPIFP